MGTRIEKKLTRKEIALLERFKKEICNKAKEIDPNDELDWFSLSKGYFLALGCNIDEADELSNEARYTYEYWQ